MASTLEIPTCCRFCDRRLAAHCARCAVPLCARHAHTDDRRCVECEREFHGRFRRRVAQLLAAPVCVTGGLLSGFAVGVVAAYFLAQIGAVFGVAPAFAIFGVVVCAVGGAAVGGAASRTLIDGTLRGQFLLERAMRPAQLPPARLLVRRPHAL